MALSLFKKKPSPQKTDSTDSKKAFDPMQAAIEESANLQIELHHTTTELEALKQTQNAQQQNLILHQAQIERLSDELREANNAKARAEVARRAAERDSERAHKMRQKIEQKIEKMLNLKAEVDANNANTTKLNDDLAQDYDSLTTAYEDAKTQLSDTKQLQQFYLQLRQIKDKAIQPLRETCQQAQAKLPPSSSSRNNSLEELSAQLNHCHEQIKPDQSLAKQEIAWLRELIGLIEQTQYQQTQWQQLLASAQKTIPGQDKKPALSVQMTELETQLLTAYENFEVFCQQQHNLQPHHLLDALITLTNVIIHTLSQRPESPLYVILHDTLTSYDELFHLRDNKLYLRDTEKKENSQWITHYALPVFTELLQLIQLDTLQATGFNYDQANFLDLGNSNVLEQTQQFVQS